MDKTAFYNISYGLFVLTAREGKKDNGCIINTLSQITTSPNRISVSVNKADYTHDMIMRTGEFNVSILTEEAPFEVFTHFGFQSGRDVDKFAGDADFMRAENGILYIPEYTNAYISGKVCQTVDMGTHTIFIADAVDAKALSGGESMTYAYYQKNVKPKPEASTKVKGWRCRVCGYIYEGEELPPDFVCPICKHGADDFEKIV